MTPSAASAARRPKTSAGRPAPIEPRMVPISALATVKPNKLSLRANLARKASVVPEMTAVSKPNNNPPKAATSVQPSR